MRKQTLHPRTAAINQKQKNESKKSRLDALQWLAKKFPEAFDNREHIRPLNLGIMNQILTYSDEAAAEASISKSKLREAVVLYTRRLDYLACLKAKEPRIDLFGKPFEPVTEEDAKRAALKIKQRVEKSIKNSRKLASSTPENQKNPKIISSENTKTPIYSAHMPERAPAYSMENNFSSTSRAQSVTITHKQTRQYDPEAVARLKEKLGLSRKKEESQ